MKELTPQQKETLEFQKHISLTANAGSGKTFVLSKRYVEVYLKNNISVEQIVAITFTDKAAGELKRRISNEVENSLAFESELSLKLKLEKLRRELVFANISTIHSFCIRILKEYALIAGIDAGFTPIDQQTSNELIELAVEEAIQRAIKNPDEENKLKYLIRLFGSKNIFRTILEKAIHQRKIIDRLGKALYHLDETEIAQYFRKEFNDCFENSFKEKIHAVRSAIKKINDHVNGFGKSNKLCEEIGELLSDGNWTSTEKIISACGGLKNLLLTSTNTVRNRGYLSKDRGIFDAEISDIEFLFEEIANILFSDFSGRSEQELARFGKNFLALFSSVDELYSSKKTQRGYLDFEDILLLTRQIIQNESVRNSLGSNYKFIMIDEYQDTNELQYEIFMPLLDDLKSGNLFVVGDEKQSIYMFRQAELEVFNKTKNEIVHGASPGKVLNLPHSFRMTGKLVLFTNKLFAKLFSNPAIEFNEVEHSNLVCAKQTDEDGSVSIIISDTENEVSEAELTVRKILHLLDTDSMMTFKDIAILCRKRDSFYELEQELVKYRVPFSIYGGKGFYQRQTIYDLYNYLSFLINPKDDTSLLGILRSPFFNLSDTKIYLIASNDGNSFFNKLEQESEKDKTVRRIFEQLNENIKLTYHTEIYSLIRKLLLESNYWTLLASSQNASQEIANIEKLLSLARGYSMKGFKTLYDFTLALKEAIEGYEDEGQAQIAQDENTVKLMTIHQAKGLEFGAVIIYSANQRGQEDYIRSKSLSIDKRFGLLTKVPVDSDYFVEYSIPPIAAFYNYSIHRKNRAELKRLLYVAVTRAIKHLIFTASIQNEKVNNGSFFQLLNEGLRNDFTGDSIYLADEVEFMKYEDDNYKFYHQGVDLTISIERDIPEIILQTGITKPKIDTKNEFIEKLTDVPKHEIISATKISMFAQCPVKYQLTYELGYSPIMNLIKITPDQFEFHSGEDEEIKRYAQLRGKLIHEILRLDIGEEQIEEYILKKLEGEDSVLNVEMLVKSIKRDLSNYYFSLIYTKLKSYPDYRNEFEVYCKEGDYFLYGIIDKLIYDGNKLLIIDYKTDNIQIDQVKERAKNYFPQLQFYAYVLSHLHPEIENFTLQLVFIKHPDEIVSKTLNKEMLKDVSLTINSAIKKIYAYNYTPNLEHCLQCQFAMEGKKCIKTYLNAGI